MRRADIWIKVAMSFVTLMLVSNIIAALIIDNHFNSALICLSIGVFAFFCSIYSSNRQFYRAKQISNQLYAEITKDFKTQNSGHDFNEGNI